MMADGKEERTRWQQFWQLDRRQKTELILAACSLFYHQILISYLPYRWWRKRLQNALKEPTEQQNLKSIDTVQTFLQLHNTATHHLPLRITCLGRSLSLLTQLRRREVACVLRIGVKLDAGQFAAHAWVEANKSVINDRVEKIEQYTLLTQCETLPPLNH